MMSSSYQREGFLIYHKNGSFFRPLCVNVIPGGGNLLLSSLVIKFLIVLLLCTGVSYGKECIQNYRTDLLMAECRAIDHALLRYSEMHTAVRADTVALHETASGGTRLSYRKARRYPATLAELGTVRAEQGYFVHSIDLSKFTYIVSTGTDDVQSYRLGVTMPNGTYYESPGSGLR